VGNGGINLSSLKRYTVKACLHFAAGCSRLPAARLSTFYTRCTTGCTTLGKLFTHRCLYHQAVLFGTRQGAVIPAAGEVTVGLASHWPCITDQWFIHLRAHGLRKGDEHPAIHSSWGMALLYSFTGTAWPSHAFLAIYSR